MHGGRLVARTLARLGVGRVFGLCGDHVNAIFDGCAEEGVRIVDVRDERAAGHAAEGTSLATGEPGVAVVTGGPGLTNAITPIANAFYAGTPMVVITSGLRAAERGRGFPQDVDHRALLAPVTVWNDAVADDVGIPGALAESFAQARARRGPVVVEVSLDAQLGRVEDADPPPVAWLPGSPSEPALAAAAGVLAEAQRPVLIAGEGCFWSDPTGSPLQSFVEATRMPCFTVRAARGLIPDAHELALGQPNFLREPVQEILGACDTLLVAGCELDIVLAFGGLAPQARLVRIETDPVRVVRSRAPEAAVVGDESRSLAGLAGRVGDSAWARWAVQARRIRDGGGTDPAPDGSPVHPARLVAEVAVAAGAGTVAVDAGHLALWALDGLPATGPGRLLSSFTTPLSTIGAGIPYAIAAKLARPDEPAIALVGDGAFGFSAIEIDTAARHGIDIVVVVGNDASWGIVRRQMEAGFGRAAGVALVARSYERVGEALGAHGSHVHDGAGLGRVLGAAVVSGAPAVVNVTLDASPEHPAMAFVTRMFAPEA